MKISKKHILFLLSFLLFSNMMLSQSKRIDSLKNELVVYTQKDSNRVNVLQQLAFSHYISDINVTQLYLNESEAILKTLDYKKGEAKQLFVEGSLLLMKGDFESTIQYFKESLQIYEAIDFKQGIADCYNALGVISRYQANYTKAIEYIEKALKANEEDGNYTDLPDTLVLLGNLNSIVGNYPKSLEYKKRALKIFKEQENEHGIGRCLESMGEVYDRMGNYSLALEYLNKSLFLKEKLQDTIGIPNNLNIIGTIYQREGYFDKSLTNFKRVLKIYTKNNHKRGIARTNIYIGNLFRDKNENTKALSYLNQALAVSEANNDLENIAVSLNYIGYIYLSEEKLVFARECYKRSEKISLKSGNLPTLSNSYWGIAKSFLGEKKYKEALPYALKSKEIGVKMKSLGNQKNVEELLFNIYKGTQNYQKALASHEEYKKINDSLFNKENTQKITQLEYEYKYKHALDSASIRELKLTKTVKSTSQDLEKSKQNYLWAIIGFLVVSIILGYIIFYQKFSNIKSKNENIVIEQKLLRSQMTPHFIFNSLSVLQGMILNKEEKKSITYLSKFSKLLRITLENSRDKMVSLSQELAAIENYLALQNLENQAYRYSVISEETIDVPLFEIPPMLIQPFVENAIEHAFSNQIEHREIVVRLAYVNKRLICKVIDNGVGLNFQKKNKREDKKSLATTITAERLKILSKDFKMEGAITIEDRSKYNEKGTMVTLVIPHKIIEI